MPEPSSLLLGIGGIVGLGLLIARRNAGWLPALGAFLGPLLLMIVALIGWVALDIEPAMAPWDGVRLAPSMALRLGWSIYPPADRGAVLGWIYGPIAALFYLPATLAGEPWAMILAGRFLSWVGYFGPVAWLLGREARRGRMPMTTAVILFGSFAILTDHSPALRYASTAILADNPAIGLGAVALGSLGLPEGGKPGRRLALAMFLATLAAWSKQLAWPIVALVGVRAWMIQGGKAAARLALIPLAVSVGLLLIFGWREIVLNLVTIPSRHPWHTTGGRPMAVALGAAFRADAWILVVLLAGWWLRDRRIPILRTTWSGFAIASMLALPIASAGFLKVGGDVNSLAHALYPGAIAALLVVGGAIQGRPFLGWLLLAGASILAWGRSEGLPESLARPGRDWRDESRQVSRALQGNPGLNYFPCHPLEHLAIDRRPFHQEYGVFDRDLAGIPLDPDHLRSGIPAGARRLVYPMGRTYAGYFMRRALPEFRKEDPDPSLPGAACYVRD
ncbi:MAG: hypothetical protein U0800_24085 [Isosphaeraceae bacterium]